MFPEQVNQAVHRHSGRDVALDQGLALVEVDFSRTRPNVAEIGIGHLSRTIDHAAHHGNLHAREVGGALLDFFGGGLQIEEGAPTGGAGDEIRLVQTGAGGLQDRLGRRNFILGRLGEGDANGVAQPVREQSADANRALDAPIHTGPRLGHAKVQRIVHALLVHALHEQPVRLHHHDGVGGLHGQHDLVVVVLAEDAQKLQCGLHHALRRIAVAVHHAVGKRTVVGADTQSASMFFEVRNQRQQRCFDALQFLGVLCVGVLPHLKLLAVGVVSGVDAHLLDELTGGDRERRAEMDVGHKRTRDAALLHSPPDGRKRLHRFLVGHGEPDDLAVGPVQALDLLHTRYDLRGVGGEHGLNADGRVASDRHIANADRPCLATKGRAGGVC